VRITVVGTKSAALRFSSRAAAACVIAALGGGRGLAQQTPATINERSPAAITQVAQAAPPDTGAQLPGITVEAQKPKPRATQTTSTSTSPKGSTGAQTPQAVPAAGAPTAAQAALDVKMQAMDQSRENILPKIGATSYTIDRGAIESLPQGDNTSIDKVVLQLPGVSYDSAVANPNFHVRNEYANVQTRINGIVLPEGVSGLGSVIDTNFVARADSTWFGSGTIACVSEVARAFRGRNGLYALAD
jgi:hypothetical protein